MRSNPKEKKKHKQYNLIKTHSYKGMECTFLHTMGDAHTSRHTHNYYIKNQKTITKNTLIKYF